MAVRAAVDARGINSSTGEGAANTVVAAANAAIALKVFILGAGNRTIDSDGVKKGFGSLV